jgi:hypothetical protein
MKIVFLSISIIVFYFNSYSQGDNSVIWAKAYGGSSADWGNYTAQTTDGGFIIAGSSSSNDGDVTGNHGNSDFWVVKTDVTGSIEWQKSYGGTMDERANCVIQTEGGGYIIAGYSSSNDGDVSGNHGSKDYWVVKTDASGNIQWQKSFGGTDDEEARCIQRTTDGGYIIAGYSMSSDGDVTINRGGWDFWVLKINSTGVVEWQKSYGGDAWDEAFSIQQTTDGGYIVAGQTDSDNGDISLNHGYFDFWIVKTDMSGAIEWQKTYGGSDGDYASKILQTIDGGYIIGGETYSTNYDVTGNHGYVDYWVVKTNQSGTIQWQKTYGGTDSDELADIIQTADEGFIMAGQSYSYDGDVTGNHQGGSDYWVVKTMPSGSIQWQQSYGGFDHEAASNILQTNEGNFIVTGWSISNNGEVTGNHGDIDYWVVKTCFKRHISISISDLFFCDSTILNANDGFENYLWNTGDTTQMINISTGGLYTVIASNPSECVSTTEFEVPDPILPFNGEQICLATVDETTGKNVLIIEKTMSVGTDSILIYRKDNQSSQYHLTGSLGINDLSIFIDDNAVPAQQSYQYKISVKDIMCGKESNLSNSHSTISLQAYIGADNEVILTWNAYEGFDYDNFEVYRSNTGSAFTLIASVSNNTFSFTDPIPPSGINKYQIRVAKQSPCVISESLYNYVSSNILNSSSIGINETPANLISLYPNPTSAKLNVNISNQLLGLSYDISDLTGRVLLKGKLSTEKSIIDMTVFQTGLYSFRISELNMKSIKVMKK